MQINKIKQHKGFILIEVVASLLIFSIFAVFSISVLASFMKGYVKECEFENEDLYVSEGMTILDSLLKGSDVDIEDNKIKVTRKDENDNNCDRYDIFFNKYTEQIEVDYVNSNRRNTLMLKIKKFRILENQNVFYIFITCNDGRRYRRCFALKNQGGQDTV